MARDRTLPPASRVHGPRKVLGELARLRLKADRAAQQRAGSDEERAWCLRVADVLEELVKTGGRVLPLRIDPRERRRARKRPQTELL